MARVLVIGYGNPLRSDDGVGLLAVRALREQLAGTDAEFVECQQLNMELAQPISEAEFVVFIDASTHGVAGEIVYQHLTPEAKPVASLSHGADPAVLLQAARELYGRAPEALLATIAGECFGYGTELTEHVARSLKGVVARLTEILRTRLLKAKVQSAN